MDASAARRDCHDSAFGRSQVWDSVFGQREHTAGRSDYREVHGRVGSREDLGLIQLCQDF